MKILWLVIFAAVLIWSGIEPKDRLTQFLEVLPAVVGLVILAWSYILIISIVLAFSAFYELIEWWVALFSGEAGDAFLGTQGYIWDTQSNMGFALLGANKCISFIS